MSKNLLTDEEVLRSYRDAEFRQTLTPEQIQFAANHRLRPDDYYADPEGELSDEDLEAVAGGGSLISCCSIISCCTSCDSEVLV
jgi:hypothetical protein